MTAAPPEKFSPLKNDAQKTAPEKIWLSEKKVMGRLGLTRDDIRSIRQEMLSEGVDWRNENRLIELSTEGIAKIEKNIGLLTAVLVAKTAHQSSANGSGGFEPPPDTTAPSPASPARDAARGGGIPFVDPARLIGWPAQKTAQRLEVVWARSKNQRVLMCVYETTKDRTNRAAWLTVKVRDNANFVPGMAVLAFHEAGAVWTFAGNPAAPVGSAPRMPRNRGRW